MSRTLRVLLVEDSPSDAAIVREAMADSPSFTMQVVTTLADADARLNVGDAIDVVLLDLGLPDSQGLDTLRQLRDRHPQIAIVVLTGIRDSDYGLAAVQQGAEDYLAKDQVNFTLLSRMMRYAVERKRLQAALLESERNHSLRLEQQVAERTALAEKRAVQLRELSKALAQSEQSERERIARLLHDSFQQMLVAAKLTASRLVTIASQEQRAKVNDRLQNVLQRAIDQSRSLTAQLCPPVLFDVGLLPALRWLCEQMRIDHELNVTLKVRSDPPTLSSELAAVVFEAVRELLFNVVKHGKTNEAMVIVRMCKDGHLKVIVADEGAGFDVKNLETMAIANHFGIQNLSHRIRLVDGQFVLKAAPGKGCAGIMLIPVTTPTTTAAI